MVALAQCAHATVAGGCKERETRSFRGEAGERQRAKSSLDRGLRPEPVTGAWCASARDSDCPGSPRDPYGTRPPSTASVAVAAPAGDLTPPLLISRAVVVTVPLWSCSACRLVLITVVRRSGDIHRMHRHSARFSHRGDRAEASEAVSCDHRSGALRALRHHAFGQRSRLVPPQRTHQVRGRAARFGGRSLRRRLAQRDEVVV